MSDNERDDGHWVEQPALPIRRDDLLHNYAYTLVEVGINQNLGYLGYACGLAETRRVIPKLLNDWGTEEMIREVNRPGGNHNIGSGLQVSRSGAAKTGTWADHTTHLRDGDFLMVPLVNPSDDHAFTFMEEDFLTDGGMEDWTAMTVLRRQRRPRVRAVNRNRPCVRAANHNR